MAKGNDGKAARRRTMKKLLVSAICALGLVFGVVYFGDNGSSSSHSKTTKPSHRKRNRKYNDKDGVYDDNVVEGPNHHNINKKESRDDVGYGYDRERRRQMDGKRNEDKKNDIHVGRDWGRSYNDETDDQERDDVGGSDYRRRKKKRHDFGGYDGRKPQHDWEGHHSFGGGRYNDGGEQEGIKYRRKINYRDRGRGYEPQGGRGFEPQGGRGFEPQGGRGFEPQGGRGFEPLGDRGYEPNRGHRNIHRKDHRRAHARGDDDVVVGGRGHGGGDFVGGFGNRIRPRHVVHMGSDGDENEEEEPDSDSNSDHRISDEDNSEESQDEEEEDRRYQRNNIKFNDEIAEQYHHQLISDQYSSGNSKKTLEGILNGSLNLVSLEGTPKKSADGSYDSVFGYFCKVNFDLHKKDPSNYPMFRFLTAASSDCQNPTRFNLKKVAYLARYRDKKIKKDEIVLENNKGPKLLNLTAVAFHESRCGSTLVANSMIAMNPTKHRAYSESPPPVNAMHICGDHFEDCSQEQAAAVLRDTIYLMSRTDDSREERVFFKFQSITSKAIPTFQMAFPSIPWIYVYREPVQVMMSHVKDDPKMKKAICTRSRSFPPKEIKAIAKRHGRSDTKKLKPSEYCAAHLAMLTESAVNSLNDMAIPVVYDHLPSMIWEKIMPKIFGRPLTQSEIDNLKDISKSYSKGGSRKDKQGEFKSDSKQKEKNAPEAIREAAKEFLKESFDQLTVFEPKLLK